MSDEKPKTLRYQRGRAKTPAEKSKPAQGSTDKHTVAYKRKGKLGQRVREQEISKDGAVLNRGAEHTRPARFVSPDGEASVESAGLVVGWLIVEKGIGKGTSLPLFNQRNSIGRSPDEAVPLVFGDLEDDQISRVNHCLIGYEPKKSLFIAEQGGRGNYTYINGDVLLSHKVLEPYDRIEIGNTVLVFVPFCGEKFQW